MADHSTASANDRQLHTTDYFEEFSTDVYLSSYTFFEVYTSFDLLLKEIVHVFLKNKERLGHERALEYGGGPALFSSFVLAQYVKSIHFTEYVVSNLTAVQDWIDEKENAHDWTELFETILEEHKKVTGDKTAQLSVWEDRLRDALKQGGLAPTGDVNSDNCPILDNPSRVDYYDVILSSLCLEAGCLNHDSYKAGVKRLSRLLKPGGFIFFTHGRNQTFAKHLDKTFFILSLNEQIVREAMEAADFVDIHVSAVERPRNLYGDADGFIVAYGYKK